VTDAIQRIENRELLTSAYEALRVEARHGGEDEHGSLGRAVMVHRGVVAWMVAWSSLRPARPRVPMTGPTIDGHRGTLGAGPVESLDPCGCEAARILAGMVLDNLQEVSQ